MFNTKTYTLISLLLFSSSLAAGPYTIPKTYGSGDPLLATELNADNTAIKTAVDDNDSRITTNTGNISTNATDITTNASDIATNAVDSENSALVLENNLIQLLRQNLLGVTHDFGPITSVPVADLTANGWAVCHNETFNLTTSLISDILTACDKANLMLACRLTGDSTIILGASAPRADVTFDTTSDTTTTHYANGVEWYFNSSLSWGFALAGDSVNKSSCDTQSTNPQYRLCLHTSSDSVYSGFRCGSNINLNSSTAYERVWLHRD